MILMTEQPKLKPDNQVANVFLQELLETSDNDGIIILRKALPGKDSGLTGAFKYEGALELRNDLQYYYTVNLRKQFNGKSQGTKQDVSHLIALYADIDYGEAGHKKDSTYETREEALKAVNEFPLKPTWLIESGHGLQVIYLFSEDLVPEEDISLDEYEALNGGLQTALGADTTPDASRLLRVPGSLNLKEEPKAVQVLEHNSDCRYSVDDFLEYVTPAEKSTVSTEALKEPLTREDYDKRSIPKRTKNIIRVLKDPKHLDKTDRSALIHSAVYQLYSKGYTPDQIFSALTEPGTATRAYLVEIKKDEASIEQYLNRSISKAQEDFKKERIQAAKRLKFARERVDLLGGDVNSTLYFWKDGAIYPVPLKRFTKDQFHFLTGIILSEEQFEEVKDDILSLAAEKGHIDMSNKLLEGVWRINGKFLLISKDAVLLLDPKDGIKSLEIPVYDHKVIDFSTASNWLDVEHFSKVYGQLSLESVYDKLLALTSQFNWKHSEAADYAAALIMLSPLQQAMSWRPWVYVLGASNSGKTTFIQDFFDKLFPGLLCHMGKTTAHAIAQNVGNSCRIPLLDEFERYNKIPQIKELAKLANRGGRKTSGTPGPNSLNYAIHQMFWFASIVSSLDGESEQNRAIILELARHDGKHPPRFPDPEEMKRLGTEIVTVMILHWQSIEERSKEIPGRAQPKNAKGDRSRMNESLSYPMALLELVEEEGRDGPFIKTPPEFVYRPVEKEEDSILEDILNSTIWVTRHETPPSRDHKDQLRVFDAIEGDQSALYNVGMSVTRTSGQEYLAIHCKSVKRFLLKDSREYDFLDISEPLKRIPGALTNHTVKIGGKPLRCVLIPLEYILRDMEEDDAVAS